MQRRPGNRQAARLHNPRKHAFRIDIKPFSNFSFGQSDPRKPTTTGQITPSTVWDLIGRDPPVKEFSTEIGQEAERAMFLHEDTAELFVD
ncbi:MAG: hypothetical protein ACOCX4_08115 [Planctomycetota bacterium]